MKEIFFPTQYKNSILNKKKNVTIRIKKELGKYKIGETYKIKSYAGNDWEVNLKIVNIISTKLGKLSEFNIPQKSINSIKNKENISNEEKVELIIFKIL